jgi:hypothetical protein
MTITATVRPLTIDDAETAAKIFSVHPPIRRIWLFGSVSREEENPHDLDLILESALDIAGTYRMYATGEIVVDGWRPPPGFEGSYPRPGTRPHAAILALGEKEMLPLYDAAFMAIGRRAIDLIVLPIGWHENVEDARHALSGEDGWEPKEVELLFRSAKLLWERT